MLSRGLWSLVVRLLLWTVLWLSSVDGLWLVGEVKLTRLALIVVVQGVLG